MTDIIEEEENENETPEEEQESVVVDNGQTYESTESAIIAKEEADKAKLWAQESERQAGLASASATTAAEAKDDAVAAKEYAEAAITDTNLITVATDLQASPSKIKTVANNITNVNAVAGNMANIDAVAGNATNINAVNANKTNIDAVAGNATNINAVANNASNINAVNANKTNIDTVAGNNTNITTVASDINRVNLVADDISSVHTVAVDISNVIDVADNKTNIDTVAGISSDVTTVAGISSDITAVASNSSNINAVAGNATNINAVNANKTNINAVAGNATNINAVNANKTNIDAVAGNSTNINAVAGDLTNINAVAADLANIDNASTYADNAEIWAEGTDAQVQALGGVHSSKGWADQSSQGQVQADWAESDNTKKSYINNKPTNLATTNTAQDITEAKAFIGNGKLVKKSTTLDINVPDGIQANQVHFTDKNDVIYSFIQSAQFANGLTQFGLACRGASTNSFTELGLYQTPDGSSYTYCPNPTETNGVNQIATVQTARDRSTFAGTTNRTALSISLSTEFTAPADGLMTITIEVAGAQSQVSILMGGSGGYVIMRVRHDGGTTQSNKIPLVFPARKGQKFYLSKSGTGTAAIDLAYIWEFPYQGV